MTDKACGDELPATKLTLGALKGSRISPPSADEVALPQHRTTSSAWMRGVANTLQVQGLDAAVLFAELGLSINNLNDPEYRGPTEKASRLWTLAAERSGNPDIGLSNPHVPRPDQYGIVGYARIASPELLLGLTRLI